MKTELHLDCPWCDGVMVAATVAIDGTGESLACATCSIVVELAADPVVASIALAA